MWNVIVLGLISFFSDISAEMVYPLIPLYLTTVFGATPVMVGVIEGIAESLSSLLKVFSGYVTDKTRRKKPIAFLGYATGLLYKVGLIFASSWAGVLGARVTDRIGKGIRTSPRDVMISESAQSGKLGKAFGIHKALDMAGSAAGILIAYLLLRGTNGNFDYKKIFLYSMIPAAIGLVMFILVKERKHVQSLAAREPFWKNIRKLDNRLKLYLLVTFIFTLGNSSNVFLLLRAKSVGFDDTTIILLYFIYNITASLLSLPFGKMSDRIGRKKILVAGYVVFAFVYTGFALAFNKPFLIAAFAVYGVYTAMITGVERAFIAEISPEGLRGSMLGLQSTISGVALLPASTIAGLLWTVLGAPAPFLFGAFMALTSAVLLQLGLMHKTAPRSSVR